MGPSLSPGSLFRRPRADPRRPWRHSCSASSRLVFRRFRTCAEAVRARGVKCPGEPVADRHPVEAAVRAYAVADALGRERHLVLVQAGDCGCVLLIPHHPGDAILGAGESDVGLHPVARGIDVEARVSRARADAGNARLLEAEAADRRDVTAVFYSFRLDAVAVDGSGADRALAEDLVLVVARRGGRLLPGNPGTGFGGIDRRAARHRRIFGGLVGVDVQRGYGHAASARASTLAREDPLALVRVAGVVEATGEDVL